ncbi:MAG: acyloxyacyl hydrolase [Verrucomicrobia bacterium]|nr:acyloxyacyl hydrolase [Verrucomicrobiota bacterium]MBS0646983.1 acyloxyacyl hydrolase [Verrucomicrobiota bacterium]
MNRKFFRVFLLSILCSMIQFTPTLCANPLCPPALFSVGGGYWDAGIQHSGGVFELEYKAGRYWYRYFRPQASLVIPNFNSLYAAVGLALELYICEHLVFCPNFSPGLYYQGQGRNLGYPLEFRSAVELAYENINWVRIGVQLFHISNANLSNTDTNPGANALVGYISIPLTSKSCCKHRCY